MPRTVFAQVASPVEEDDFLADFKIVEGNGTLHGLTECQYVICSGMTYAQGQRAENNMVVGGYKPYDPDDGSNLRELGFKWNADLDAPAVEVRGRRPQ